MAIPSDLWICVTSGPSREDLFDGLRLAFEDGFFEEKRDVPVRFTLRLTQGSRTRNILASRELEARVRSIGTREGSRNGHDWVVGVELTIKRCYNVEGQTCFSTVTIPATIHYNTKSRRGSFVENDIIDRLVFDYTGLARGIICYFDEPVKTKI